MKRNRVYLPQSLPLPFSAEQLDPLPRLIAILESSFDGIFVTDAQARPIWCNHSYEVISGLTAQEVLGVPMGELVRRGTISHSATLEALAQGQAVTINQTFTTGKRAVVTSTPIYDQTDQICLVVTNVRDISELIALQETLDHQRRLSARYQQEIAVIRDQLLHTPQLVAEDPATLNLLRIVGRAAQLDTVVLIQGETGTGKERIASYIHQNSPRARKNFIRVNCGAIPESLAESELFGYERGAFTGANREGKPGLFEVAHEGTIFLDEVGELSLATQTKLLRVLQEKEITRVGWLATTAAVYETALSREVFRVKPILGESSASTNPVERSSTALFPAPSQENTMWAALRGKTWAAYCNVSIKGRSIPSQWRERPTWKIWIAGP